MFGDGSELSKSTGFSAVSRAPRDIAPIDDDKVPRLFYGPNAKALYDQLVLMTSHDGKGGWKIIWIRGEKRTELVLLDTDDNLALIFKDLGIYGLLGTPCDNV
jgi:hypothetical protein